MEPDLLDAVRKIDETAFAEHLRLLDQTVDVNRRRLEKQDEELLRLQAQVRSVDETFKRLRIRTAAPAVPAMCPQRAPVPPAAPFPQAVPAPARPSAVRRRLWPYAVLAAAALTLAPSVSFQTGSSVSAQATAPAPAAATDRGTEAIGLALSFRPEGVERTFADLLGPELDIAGRSAWQTQSVGEGIYLVSFRPHDIRGPQADYEFTVDVNARSVVPEAETSERLNSGAPSVADR